MFRLNALPRRAIAILDAAPSGHGCTATASAMIGGTAAALTSVFVQLRWPGRVDYLVLSGRAGPDGRLVRERLAGRLRAVRSSPSPRNGSPGVEQRADEEERRDRGHDRDDDDGDLASGIASARGRPLDRAILDGGRARTVRRDRSPDRGARTAWSKCIPASAGARPLASGA